MSEKGRDNGRISLNRPSSPPGGPEKGRSSARQKEKSGAERKKEKAARKAARARDRARAEQGGSGRIMMKRSETSSDVEQLKKEKEMTRKFKKGNRVMVVLGVVLVMVFFFSTAMFVTVQPEHLHLSFILEQSREQTMRFFNFITGAGAEGGIQFITWRYIMIVLAGACLAASGAVYQGTFKNILASPTTLGVMSGGTLGNILYALFFASVATESVRLSELSTANTEFTLLSRNIQSLMVLLGCFGAVVIVVGITLMLGRGKIKSNHLIITGIIFSSVIGSFSGLVQYSIIMKNPSDPRLDIIRAMTMGGFGNAYKYDQLLMMLAFLAPCVVILMCMAGRMDILALGDEQARTMGLNVTVFKNVIIGINTVMTAVIIAFCGQIGFIGFIIPLAARRLVGPGFRKLLPASMLMGATLLLIIYDVAHLLSMIQYMNVLTSAFGSIVMVIALLKGGGVARAD